MYQCKVCGNKKSFYEHNNMVTHITLDEQTGKITYTFDEYLDCVEVVCEVCNASTEDNAILNNDGEVVKIP